MVYASYSRSPLYIFSYSVHLQAFREQFERRQCGTYPLFVTFNRDSITNDYVTVVAEREGAAQAAIDDLGHQLHQLFNG